MRKCRNREIPKRPKTVKPRHNQLRELLLTALEQCWDGHLPFRELEKALVLHKLG